MGDGERKAELRSLSAALDLSDAVDFVGFQLNPYAYVSRCDVYALSSRWECLPTALIEALACGVPVVATRCPHGPEEILENGKWGRLTPVGDPEAMARALLEALDDPRDPSSLGHFRRLHTAREYGSAYAALIGT